MRRILSVTVLAVFLAATAASTAFAAKWWVPGDFATIQEAIDSPSVAPGDVIMVGPGSHAGALVTKAVEIRGTGGALINTGPPHDSGRIQGFRLMAGSDGAVISHLTFEVDFGIFNGDAINGVTVIQNRFLNAFQAVTNWGGSGWDISHNDIIDLRADNGGGIGIFIGDWMAVPGGVVDNEVAHNTISGTLHVDPEDSGGYSGAGIVIYADFREPGGLGAVALADNKVTRNKVAVVSDNPTLVDINAFELTDTRHEVGVIYDNAIGFNDFRGTANQIHLAPEELAGVNVFSRNLGTNRGHGLHPSVFR